MKKRALVVSLSWLMVFLTMLIIYNFSAQTGEESEKTSDGLIKDVLEVVIPEEEITEDTVKKFQIPVRKTAHFCIFMLLGFCFANAFVNSFKIKQVFIYTLSIISVFLYASFDEIHQSFTVNRVPSFIDVVIDSCGGAVGGAAFILMMLFINKFSKKRIRC